MSEWHQLHVFEEEEEEEGRACCRDKNGQLNKPESLFLFFSRNYFYLKKWELTVMKNMMSVDCVV